MLIDHRHAHIRSRPCILVQVLRDELDSSLEIPRIVFRAQPYDMCDKGLVQMQDPRGLAGGRSV